MAFVGNWKIKGVVETSALIKVKRVFGGKNDGGMYQSLIHVYEPTGEVLLEELNGPPAPYVEGADAVRLAYYALGLQHPELIPDQPVVPPGNDVLNGFRAEEKDAPQEVRVDWYQRIKNFFRIS
jgi:hypothetical protein